MFQKLYKIQVMTDRKTHTPLLGLITSLITCVCWFVYLSAGLHTAAEPICTEFGGGMGHGPAKNLFIFRADPDNLPCALKLFL